MERDFVLDLVSILMSLASDSRLLEGPFFYYKKSRKCSWWSLEVAVLMVIHTDVRLLKGCSISGGDRSVNWSCFVSLEQLCQQHEVESQAPWEHHFHLVRGDVDW